MMSAIAGLLFFTSCVKNENINDSYTKTQELKNLNNDLAVQWMNLSFVLTKETPGFTSPVAARNYAYLSLAMYEVLVPGIKGYTSMQGRYQGFSKGTMKHPNAYGEISWEASFNECMYNLYKRLFINSTPEAKKEIEELYTKLQTGLVELYGEDVMQNSKQYGIAQANAIFEYSVTDGQAESYLNNYIENINTPNREGIWSPSVHGNKKPLQPKWGEVRTFIKHHAEDMNMVSPPEFSDDKNSLLYASALEVRNRAENLNFSDEVLVKYWDDDREGDITPAGHMLAILCQSLENENKDLGFAVYAMMIWSTVMHYATVAAWKTKYTYYTMRPETYIRQYIDRDFLSLSNATATPEYSSGQAAVSAAAAEVLGGLFGYNYAFTDKTYQYRKDIDGSPRSFHSFQDMAEEVLNSNLLGGIHYRFSLEAGQKQGIDIAKNYNAIR